MARCASRGADVTVLTVLAGNPDSQTPAGPWTRRVALAPQAMRPVPGARKTVARVPWLGCNHSGSRSGRRTISPRSGRDGSTRQGGAITCRARTPCSCRATRSGTKTTVGSRALSSARFGMSHAPGATRSCRTHGGGCPERRRSFLPESYLAVRRKPTKGSPVEGSGLPCVPEPTATAQPKPMALGARGVAQRRRARLAQRRRANTSVQPWTIPKLAPISIAPPTQQGSKIDGDRTGQYGDAEQPRRAPAGVARVCPRSLRRSSAGVRCSTSGRRCWTPAAGSVPDLVAGSDESALEFLLLTVVVGRFRPDAKARIEPARIDSCGNTEADVPAPEVTVARPGPRRHMMRQDPRRGTAGDRRATTAAEQGTQG